MDKRRWVADFDTPKLSSGILAVDSLAVDLGRITGVSELVALWCARFDDDAGRIA